MTRLGDRIGRRHGAVYRITDAQVGLHDDQSVRVRNYVMSMLLRIVLLLAAVVATGWLRWTFAAGAIFIPYFAVVIANGGRERSGPAVTLVDPAAPGLPAGDPTHDFDDRAG